MALSVSGAARPPVRAFALPSEPPLMRDARSGLSKAACFSNPDVLPPPVEKFGYLHLSPLHRVSVVAVATLSGVLPQQLGQVKVNVRVACAIALRFLAALYLARVLVQEFLRRPTMLSHPFRPTRFSVFKRVAASHSNAGLLDREGLKSAASTSGGEPSGSAVDLHQLLVKGGRGSSNDDDDDDDDDAPPTAAAAATVLHFSHGFGASSMSWLGVMPEVAKSLSATCVATDAMGFGFSRFANEKGSFLEGYGIGENSDMAMEALGEEKTGCDNFVFVGHSMGAAQALRMAEATAREGKNVKVLLVSPAIVGADGKVLPKVPQKSSVVRRGFKFFMKNFGKFVTAPVGRLVLRRLVYDEGFWKKGLGMAWGDKSR